MRDQRILSAEHFNPNSHLNVFRRLQDDSFQARQIAESELKGHIAALTEQHAAELARVTEELEQGHAAYRRLCDSLEIAGNELARVTKERDEARKWQFMWKAFTRRYWRNFHKSEDQVKAMTVENIRNLRLKADLFAANASLSRVTAELAALKAERAEDTARLDWLETSNVPFDGTQPLRWVIEEMQFRRAANVRAAIDAARGAGKDNVDVGS